MRPGLIAPGSRLVHARSDALAASSSYPVITVTVNVAGNAPPTPVTIERVSPGLFAADQNGQGVAAAVVLRVGADGRASTSLAATCGATGPCSPNAIDVSAAAGQVFLSLYGTGFRGVSGTAGVSVTIGGTPVEVQFAGAQAEFPGLDQVNVKLTPALAGKGDAAIVVTVDGKTANTATVRIR